MPRRSESFRGRLAEDPREPAAVPALLEDEPVPRAEVRAVLGVGDSQHELVEATEEADLERGELDRRVLHDHSAYVGPPRAAGVEVEVDHLDVPVPGAGEERCRGRDGVARLRVVELRLQLARIVHERTVVGEPSIRAELDLVRVLTGVRAPRERRGVSTFAPSGGATGIAPRPTAAAESAQTTSARVRRAEKRPGMALRRRSTGTHDQGRRTVAGLSTAI